MSKSIDFKLNNKVSFFFLFHITEQKNMHLYWVQTVRFWQQGAAARLVWKEALLCSRWLWRPWKWSLTKTAARGDHTLAHTGLRASRGRRHKRKNLRDVGKRHVEGGAVGNMAGDTIVGGDSPCRRRSFWGTMPRGEPHHKRDMLKGLSQGRDNPEGPWHMDALHWGRDSPEGLQPTGNPYQGKDGPEGQWPMGDPRSSRGAVRSTGQQRNTSEKQEAAQRNCCADDPNLVGLGRTECNPQGKQGELTSGRGKERCWTEVELGMGEERCFCACLFFGQNPNQ